MKIYSANKLDNDYISQLTQDMPFTYGAGFITDKGEFIDLNNRYSSHFHFYVDVLNLYDSIPDSYTEFSHPEKYDNYFVIKYNWIRLRIYDCLMVTLPKYLSPVQWDSLQLWLTTMETKKPGIVICISILGESFASLDEVGFGRSVFTEDIIKSLKRYYSCGKLYI